MVSALQVRKDSTRRPECGPRGPMAVVKGVVGSQAACGESRLASSIRVGLKGDAMGTYVAH
jgi:hypothetical protein